MADQTLPKCALCGAAVSRSTLLGWSHDETRHFFGGCWWGRPDPVPASLLPQAKEEDTHAAS